VGADLLPVASAFTSLGVHCTHGDPKGDAKRKSRVFTHQFMNMGMTRCRYWSESGALKTPAREGPLV